MPRLDSAPTSTVSPLTTQKASTTGTQSGANLKVILRAVLELATLYRGLYRARRRGNA